jgi:hypothetical protein
MADSRLYFVDLGRARPWALNVVLSIPRPSVISSSEPQGHWVWTPFPTRDLPQDFDPCVSEDAKDKANRPSLCAWLES